MASMMRVSCARAALSKRDSDKTSSAKENVRKWSSHTSKLESLRHLTRRATMSEFVYLFRTSETQQTEAMGTPERARKSMQVWLAWIRELEANGHLKDPGQPLALQGKVVR